MEVPRKSFPLSPPELVRSLARAYRAERGSGVPRNMLAIAAAIIGLENARGKALLWYNYGNIAWVGQGGAPDWWVHPKPSEGAPLKFVAWGVDAAKGTQVPVELGHEIGARAWWRLMFRRYSPVLARGMAADPKGAVHELYRLGYVQALSPGEEQGYARAVARMFSEALDDWIPRSKVYADPFGPIALVLGLGAAFWPQLRKAIR